MNKKEILSEIKRIAEKEGKAPGIRSFAAETGLRKSDWYPALWLRWNDAVSEAGCSPNTFSKAHDSDFLIVKYIELIRELGRFPIEGELRRKRVTDDEFPNEGSFRQLGSKPERAQKIIEYCREQDDYEDIISICVPVANIKSKSSQVNSNETEKVGYVYLVRHGKRNEYKIGRTYNPIRREGEIRIELPEKIQPIHYIETDDPAGIEKYWHGRFASKRKEGEWFSLSAEDVRAFKRWRRIY